MCLVDNFIDWNSINATNILDWAYESVEVTATDLGSLNSSLSGAIGLFSDGEAICYDKCGINSEGDAVFSNNNHVINLPFPAELEWVRGVTLDTTTYSIYIVGDGLSCTLKRYNRIPGEALPPLFLNEYVDDLFLPLEGGTMSGSIITPANDNMGIIPASDNYGQIGSSNKKFYRMYASTFYGNLSGNATTATSATSATSATNATNATKVTHYSSSANGNYPLLFSASTSPSSGTAYSPYYDSGVTLNPYTNVISGASITGSAASLTTARTIDGISFNGTANISHYGECTTASTTAAKTVTISGLNSLIAGTVIYVKFKNGNSYIGDITLNVNSLGAKTIYTMDGIAPGVMY